MVRERVQQRRVIAGGPKHSREGSTMSKPVPQPRRQIFSPKKTEDKDELFKCSSAPQSPTKFSKGNPPPVLPKKVIIRRIPGGPNSSDVALEIAKMMAARSLDDKAKPPSLSQKPPKKPDDENEDLDDSSLMDWWKDVTPWKYLCKDLKLRGKKETKIIRLEVEHLYKAIRVYILLLSEHGDFLREQTNELLRIADNSDKVSKGTKIAGITGGATTVAGGVAAAAGVILSPITAGLSLALTVVGVGVATAGGLTGASAAIANKVNFVQDKKKLEKTFQEYEHCMEDIQKSLEFINEGMELLMQHDLSALHEVKMDSERVARVVQLTVSDGRSSRAIEANSKAAGLIKGFAEGIDAHFTKGKDGEKKLKNGHLSKLAQKIRKLAEGVNEALDEQMKAKDLYTERLGGK